MVSLVAGWPVGFEEDYVKERNSEGIMSAGAGWDIFMLCPERALQSFEAAAKLSNPIAAYNAALMRLERGKGDDVKVATNLLMQADKLGDKKARTMLRKINREGM
jgi:TPR repeat protein